MTAQPAGTVVVQQPHPNGGNTITTIAGGIFDSFRTSPILLLIVILNMAFAGAASYYLMQVERYRADDRKQLAAIIDKCIIQTVPVSYLEKYGSQQYQFPPYYRERMHEHDTDQKDRK